MRKVKKVKKEKPKSLLRKFIEVAWEQAQRKKALRLLSKQEWSVDFLTALLVRSARYYGTGLELVVTSPHGETVVVRNTNGVRNDINDGDDVFQHLDDDAYVDDYIMRHGR